MDKKPSVKKLVQFSVTLVWAGAVVALLSRTVGQWCLWVGLGITAIGVIIRYYLVRCPHCGSKITDSNRLPDRCPNCGEKLS